MELQLAHSLNEKLEIIRAQIKVAFQQALGLDMSHDMICVQIGLMQQDCSNAIKLLHDEIILRKEKDGQSQSERFDR